MFANYQSMLMCHQPGVYGSLSEISSQTCLKEGNYRSWYWLLMSDHLQRIVWIESLIGLMPSFKYALSTSEVLCMFWGKMNSWQYIAYYLSNSRVHEQMDGLEICYAIPDFSFPQPYFRCFHQTMIEISCSFSQFSIQCLEATETLWNLHSFVV